MDAEPDVGEPCRVNVAPENVTSCWHYTLMYMISKSAIFAVAKIHEKRKKFAPQKFGATLCKMCLAPNILLCKVQSL